MFNIQIQLHTHVSNGGSSHMCQQLTFSHPQPNVSVLPKHFLINYFIEGDCQTESGKFRPQEKWTHT